MDARLVERCYQRAHGGQWRVPLARFTEALEASVARALAGGLRDTPSVERYVESLHLEDLALACACAAGDEAAWEHFVREQRPLLYRAADVLDPSGGARDLADGLYADLFGLEIRLGERQSLFRYFHGRSSLTTWLRAVLAQRHVDRLRTRRPAPLPDEDSAAALLAPPQAIEPGRQRCLACLRRGLEHAVASLPVRDRLRLASYYGHALTLAETGRILGEHEATVSRQLPRTRRVIRDGVERHLRVEAGLSEAEVAECFASVAADAGPLDLRDMLGVPAERKKSGADRSNERTTT